MTYAAPIADLGLAAPDVPLWTPSEARVEASGLARFERHLHRTRRLLFDSYDELWQWSIDQREDFWAAVWELGAVRTSAPWTEVLRDGDRMPGSQWFPGARLNYAENLLRYRDQRSALVFQDERQLEPRTMSYAELHDAVARLAARLRELGIQPGDVVAAYTPNLPEVVVAMLAATSIGATWTSCSQDFGPEAVLDRFAQVKPKLLFAGDGYFHKGMDHHRLEQVRAVREGLPSVEHLVIIPYVVPGGRIDGIAGALLFDDLAYGGELPPLVFEQLPFDHPLYVMYSSGTTGKPKAIVHGAGGTLLQHLKEHRIHCDLVRSSRIFYATTTGWMMWNWLVGALSSGCTVLLSEGAAFHPEHSRLWRFADNAGVTHFGTSAGYIGALRKAGYEPGKHYKLTALQTVLSTGSPLSADNFRWVYRAVKQDLHLASISGGTDIISCFALGSSALPVHAGQLQVRGLGMAVDAWDGDGHSVRGATGELVCTKSFPSMPVGFWDDPDDARYRAAYFDTWADTWRHGDWIRIEPSGGLRIMGRSDATLNPGGVRIGTAEIYRCVDELDAVTDSLVVARAHGESEQIVLFVQLREGLTLDEPLEASIRRAIRSKSSPRHVPKAIHQLRAIPRTRSGKKVELAVRRVLEGLPVDNRSALANPEALDEVAAFAG